MIASKFCSFATTLALQKREAVIDSHEHSSRNIAVGRYLPPSKVNDLLLADISRVRTASHVDAYMSNAGSAGVAEEMEAFDIMDLASFLE